MHHAMHPLFFIYILPMNLLWLDLNCSFAHSSLALPALHANACDKVPDVVWMSHSATINESPTVIASDIYTYAPDVLACTCWLFTRDVLLPVLARVHALLPSCKIVLGGPEFLDDNKEFLLNHPFVHCVFRGEGEESFAAWLQVSHDRHQWNTISGLCYFDSEGLYHDNGFARVPSFSSLPSPESSSFFNWSKPFVQLETTRGCFNTCSFCVSGGDKPVRSLPIEKVHSRLQLIRSHGIKEIRLLDRTFNFNKRYACQLLDLFLEFPDMHFHLEIHPALLSSELRARISTLPHGLLHLEAGIQSLHQNVLDESHRLGKLEDALDGLKFLCSLDNTVTHVDLIAGLPHYTLMQIFDDVRKLASLRADEIQLELLKVLPGTDMRRRASSLGLVFSPTPPYEILATPSISPKELQRSHQLSRLLDFYYNTESWQSVFRDLLLNYPDFLSSFLDHLIRIHVIDQPLALDRRGVILYEFCKQYYPDSLHLVVCAWLEGGHSLKKQPAEYVRTKHIESPSVWDIGYGSYTESLRLCLLDMPGLPYLVWYGYDSQSQNPKPVFKAHSLR